MTLPPSSLLDHRPAELALSPVRKPLVAMGIAAAALVALAGLGASPMDITWRPVGTFVLAALAIASTAWAWQSRQAQVRAREASLHTLLLCTVDWHWEIDTSLRFTRFTGAQPNATVQRQASAIGKTVWELPDLVLIEITPEQLRDKLLARQPLRDVLTRRINEGNRPVYFSVSGVPCYDKQGRFTGYIGTGRNISNQRATEHALRRSEALLEHLYATTRDVISMCDLDTGRYVMVNPSWSELFGLSAEQALGKTSDDLGIWRLANVSRDEFMGRLKAQGRIEQQPLKITDPKGCTRHLLLSAATFSMDGCDYLVVNSRDVTDNERAQLEHRAILRHASIGIALTRDGHFAQANPCFEAMFGWPEGSLRGQNECKLFPQVNAMGSLQAIAGLGAPCEFEVTRGDGSVFWCRLHGQAVDPSDEVAGGTLWIAEDVSEQRHIEQALADARDVAEAANRAKSAFLANTSHEIRTPLHGLVGLAELANKPGLDEARRQQYVAQIGDSARSLSGIISDILDLSKIEAGRFTLDDVAFDLHKLLDTVHHAYTALADVRSLQLELRVADDVPVYVRGDPMRLRQILSNYITNGIKFTARGFVQIGVESRGQTLRFEVSDSGPGIDEATQAKLFQPFSQGDNSTTRQFGGTGLGLSICKELAQLMGGQVGMHSRAGQGSCFWVELPLRVAQAPAAAQALRDASPLAGKRVLLVEDNPVNMTIGSALLEQWGVEVYQAEDGVACLDAVDEATRDGRPFAAVLMDVQMPRLSGHEAARRLRATESAKKLPIVALTAAAMVSERDEALAAGMDDFLTKPVDAKELLEVLLRVVHQDA